MALIALDLFGGAGGLTVGLKAAGFDVVGAVDNAPLAVTAYRANHPEARVWQRNVQGLDPLVVADELGFGPGDLALLAGCPPCQGFSTIRTRHKGTNVRDRRNGLVAQFARWAEVLRPRALMMENVPGLADDIRLARVLGRVRRAGYVVTKGVLDAVDYGVPQRRKRLGPLARALAAERFALGGPRQHLLDGQRAAPHPRHARPAAPARRDDQRRVLLRRRLAARDVWQRRLGAITVAPAESAIREEAPVSPPIDRGYISMTAYDDHLKTLKIGTGIVDGAPVGVYAEHVGVSVDVDPNHPLHEGGRGLVHERGGGSVHRPDRSSARRPRVDRLDQRLTDTMFRLVIAVACSLVLATLGGCGADGGKRSDRRSVETTGGSAAGGKCTPVRSAMRPQPGWIAEAQPGKVSYALAQAGDVAAVFAHTLRAGHPTVRATRSCGSSTPLAKASADHHGHPGRRRSVADAPDAGELLPGRDLPVLRRPADARLLAPHARVGVTSRPHGRASPAAPEHAVTARSGAPARTRRFGPNYG